MMSEEQQLGAARVCYRRIVFFLRLLRVPACNNKAEWAALLSTTASIMTGVLQLLRSRLTRVAERTVTAAVHPGHLPATR